MCEHPSCSCVRIHACVGSHAAPSHSTLGQRSVTVLAYTSTMARGLEGLSTSRSVGLAAPIHWASCQRVCVSGGGGLVGRRLAGHSPVGDTGSAADASCCCTGSVFSSSRGRLACRRVRGRERGVVALCRARGPPASDCCGRGVFGGCRWSSSTGLPLCGGDGASALCVELGPAQDSEQASGHRQT